MRKLRYKKANHVFFFRIIELIYGGARLEAKSPGGWFRALGPFFGAKNFSHCSFLMGAIPKICPLVSLDISAGTREGLREHTEPNNYFIKAST